jgi:hypothetical protein
LILTGCIESPTEPENNPPYSSTHGAYILCEGLWGRDNATLDRYDFPIGTVLNDIYQAANPGMKLGDLASDFVVWKDIALISVTTTRTIEKIDLKSGKSLGRVFFKEKRAPRKIAIINDSLAAVTDLLNHCITFFNTYSLEIIKDSVPVGPAPEGIAYTGSDVLLVVNSGYGDYLADKPKAGSVSVISINTFTEIGNFYIGPNPIEILINKKYDKFYVSYNNLPSFGDSLGGIVEFDLATLKETARLRTNALCMTFTSSLDSLLFISDSTVSCIVPKDFFEKHTLIANENNSEIWYSLGCSADGSIFIGNAMNYQIGGKLMIYHSSDYTKPVSIFRTGVNPNKIVFY